MDWEKIRIFLKFLKIFYDGTLWFSGANYVTSNSLFFFFFFFSFFFYFLELISIHNTIDLEYEKDGYLLRKMAD